MINRDIEDLFRRWYRDAVGESTNAPDGLHARVAAIPDLTPRRAPIANRPLMLIAAALVSTMLVTLAVAGGSQLLRTAPVEPSPSASSDATPMASPTLQPAPAMAVVDEALSECGSPLEEGVAMRLVSIRPGLDTELIVTEELIVYEDGRVVTGSRLPIGLEDSWRQRRLTEAGLDALFEALAASSLPNCQTFYAGADYGIWGLDASLDGGPLNMSVNEWGVRRTAPHEMTMVREFIGQFADLGAFLPADLWAEDDWQPYLPDRWELVVSIDATRMPPCDPAPQVHGCPPSGIRLSDGSDLMTFGTYFPATPSHGSPSRCGVVPRADVEQLVDSLGLQDGGAPGGAAYEGSVRSDAYELGVSVSGKLPHQLACDRPGRPASAPLPPDALPDTDPCNYIPRDAWVELDLKNPSELPVFVQGSWSWCSFWAQSGDLHVSLRVRPTSSQEADSYARWRFGGEGLTTEAISTHTVYFNACFEASSGCNPAVAISAEPYLLIIWVNWHDSRDELRALAEAIIREGLPSDDPAASPRSRPW